MKFIIRAEIVDKGVLLTVKFGSRTLVKESFTEKTVFKKIYTDNRIFVERTLELSKDFERKRINEEYKKVLEELLYLNSPRLKAWRKREIKK